MRRRRRPWVTVEGIHSLAFVAWNVFYCRSSNRLSSAQEVQRECFRKVRHESSFCYFFGNFGKNFSILGFGGSWLERLKSYEWRSFASRDFHNITIFFPGFLFRFPSGNISINKIFLLKTFHQAAKSLHICRQLLCYSSSVMLALSS